MNMFKSEDMIKLRIFCHKEKLKDVVDSLHKAKAIDIIEHKKTDDIDIGVPMEESGAISDSAIKCRSLIHTLNLSEGSKSKKDYSFKKSKRKGNYTLKDVIEKTVELHGKVTGKNNRLAEIEEGINQLTEKKEVIEKIRSLGLPLDYYNETKTLSYLIGYVDNTKNLMEGMKEEIKKNYQIFTSPNQDTPLVSIFFEKDKEWAVLKVLKDNGFQGLKIPDEFRERKVDIKSIEKDLESLRKEKEKIHAELNKIKEEHGEEIVENEKTLARNIEKAEAPLLFGETKNVSIISGWVPLNKKEDLEEELKKITGDRISIIEEEPKGKDPAPVKLNNPENAKPYEFFLRIFSMPSYRELDPTSFMFITFPLFFGLMLGDIGYALVVFVLFNILKRYIPQGKELFRIIIYCSISSFIFGMLYGEFFGFSLSYIGVVADWMAAQGLDFFHRIPDSPKSIENLMIVAVVAGIAHINFGFMLGFFNVYKNHGFVHAMLEKFSWIVFEIGIVLIILSYIGFLPINILPGILVILIAIVMLALGEGVKGVVELPSLFVHTGSYLRLMAIGMAKKGLAIVINEQTLLNPAFQGGALAVLAGIILFVIGHTINLALGVFGPFIHSLRLHYVENFTKFYEGGGKEFVPFGAKQ